MKPFQPLAASVLNRNLEGRDGACLFLREKRRQRVARASHLGALLYREGTEDVQLRPLDHHAVQQHNHVAQVAAPPAEQQHLRLAWSVWRPGVLRESKARSRNRALKKFGERCTCSAWTLGQGRADPFHCHVIAWRGRARALTLKSIRKLVCDGTATNSRRADTSKEGNLQDPSRTNPREMSLECHSFQAGSKYT